MAAPAGSLRHIVLGLGLQNYTCSDVGATPVATGALAVLYDIANLYPGRRNGRSGLSQEEFDALPLNALYAIGSPILQDSPASPFPPGDSITLDGVDSPIPAAGQHFFNSNGTPQFVIGATNALCAKQQNVTAPAGTDAGPEGTGAVDWLLLSTIEGSAGASSVYRVLTVGGAPHTCDVAGDSSTTYSTMYWVYE